MHIMGQCEYTCGDKLYFCFVGTNYTNVEMCNSANIQIAFLFYGMLINDVIIKTKTRRRSFSQCSKEEKDSSRTDD